MKKARLNHLGFYESHQIVTLTEAQLQTILSDGMAQPFILLCFPRDFAERWSSREEHYNGLSAFAADIETLAPHLAHLSFETPSFERFNAMIDFCADMRMLELGLLAAYQYSRSATFCSNVKRSFPDLHMATAAPNFKGWNAILPARVPETSGQRIRLFESQLSFDPEVFHSSETRINHGIRSFKLGLPAMVAALRVMDLKAAGERATLCLNFEYASQYRHLYKTGFSDTRDQAPHLRENADLVFPPSVIDELLAGVPRGTLRFRTAVIGAACVWWPDFRILCHAVFGNPGQPPAKRAAQPSSGHPVHESAELCL